MEWPKVDGRGIRYGRREQKDNRILLWKRRSFKVPGDAGGSNGCSRCQGVCVRTEHGLVLRQARSRCALVCGQVLYGLVFQYASGPRAVRLRWSKLTLRVPRLPTLQAHPVRLQVAAQLYLATWQPYCLPRLAVRSTCQLTYTALHCSRSQFWNMTNKWIPKVHAVPAS